VGSTRIAGLSAVAEQKAASGIGATRTLTLDACNFPIPSSNSSPSEHRTVRPPIWQRSPRRSLGELAAACTGGGFSSDGSFWEVVDEHEGDRSYLVDTVEGVNRHYALNRGNLCQPKRKFDHRLRIGSAFAPFGLQYCDTLAGKRLLKRLDVLKPPSV